MDVWARGLLEQEQEQPVVGAAIPLLSKTDRSLESVINSSLTNDAGFRYNRYIMQTFYCFAVTAEGGLWSSNSGRGAVQ